MIFKPEDEEVITKMIFDGTTEEENYVKPYWLASHGWYLDTSFGGFSPGRVGGGFATNGIGEAFSPWGNWSASELAVRPVVCLKSEVTVEEIEKTTGSEEAWSGEGPSSYAVEEGFLDYGQITE